MRLIIAEKPSLGRAIAQYLPSRGEATKTHIMAGSDTVTWCFGHLLEMAEPEDYDPALKQWSADKLPIIPDEWKLLPRPDAKGQIAVIKKLLKAADSVVNAGDPDREGQLLVDELLEHLGNRKPVSRIWLAALDEASVRKALASMRPNEGFANLKNSAEARQRADWLVGVNLTRAYSIVGQKQGYRGVLSVGRVQTPTLALVVGRDHEIEHFKAQDYYVLCAIIGTAQSIFKARWRPSDAVTLDGAGRLVSPVSAHTVAAKIDGKRGMVAKCDVAEKAQAAPLPYCLSTLQADANKRLGLSAQKVLDLAQELYEKKLTSYPRTDCRYLPASMFAQAAGVLDRLAHDPELASIVKLANPSTKSAVWNDSKITAHHAIIPIGERASFEAGSSATAVYRMIVEAYVSQFLPPHRYEQIDIEVVIEGERFTATGRKTLAVGWRSLIKDEAPDTNGNEDEDEAQALPVLEPGETVTCKRSELDAKRTTPPPRFTEGTLIKAMVNIHRFVTDPEIKKRLRETAGIGTEATRAGIIELLKQRSFIAVKGKQLISTDAGRSLIGVLPAALTSPGLTALFEQGLQKIGEGGLSGAAFVDYQAGFVKKQVDLAAASSLKMPVTVCPTCNEGHLRRVQGSNGPFWGCSRYSEGCKATYPDKGGKLDLHGDKKTSSKSAPKSRKRQQRPSKRCAT